MAVILSATLLVGCSDKPKPYPAESRFAISAARPMVWAIAPAFDLSGQKGVDPLLQADLVYQQLQEMQGLTIIPVNRTAQALWQMHIDRISSPSEVVAVCHELHCDGLVIPTVTAYDPYDPPKFGGALQLFLVNLVGPTTMPSTQPSTRPVVTGPRMMQAVGMFDAANGSVRQQLAQFAAGREDPNAPLAGQQHFVVMDNFNAFAWHELAKELLRPGEFGR
jgi:hypothetical protein